MRRPWSTTGCCAMGEKSGKCFWDWKGNHLFLSWILHPVFSVNIENSVTAWSWDSTFWNTELAPVWALKNYYVLWMTQVTHTHTHTRVANHIIHFMHILLANKKEILEIKDETYATAFYWCVFKELILYIWMPLWKFKLFWFPLK
jgi:hypothetical protein